MSLAFAQGQEGVQRVNRPHSTVAKLLDENSELLRNIQSYQNRGRLVEANQYEKLLHRNLMHLATISDNAQAAEELRSTADSARGGGVLHAQLNGHSSAPPPNVQIPAQLIPQPEQPTRVSPPQPLPPPGE